MELKIKNDFPIFQKNKNLIYLDSASTTQKPSIVLDKILDYYTKYNANVHRGAYTIAEQATYEYEQARKIIAQFINCNKNEIIFTKGTTESINTIAYSWGMDLKPNDEIIISEIEHHSNILPWQMLQKIKKIKLRYIPVLKSGELNLDLLDSLITNKTKLVSITHMSNTIGTIIPIEKIIPIIKVKNKKIKVLIDAAQSISHMNIDVKKINCDFLAFSGHKIMGPTGVGILYINQTTMEKMEPFLRGGHMLKKLNKTEATWNDSPWKFEAGTSNIAQAIALGESIKYITNIGIQNIYSYESSLLKYLLNKLKKIDDITIYSHNKTICGPVVSFNIKNCHPFDIAKLLDASNIAIRAGHHCSQLLMQSFNIDFTNRISLYAYNTKDDIDYFIMQLTKIKSILIK